MEGSTLEIKLKPDIDNFENRYRYLLRNTNLLYERGFQLIMSVFMTICLGALTFGNRHEWYSYVLVSLALIGIWTTFFQTDKLRKTISNVPKDSALLLQMRQRKIVLEQIWILRVSGIIYALLSLASIWSFRSPEKLMDWTALFAMSVGILFALGALVYSRKKLGTTRTYLDNIIKVLEQE